MTSTDQAPGARPVYEEVNSTGAVVVRFGGCDWTFMPPTFGGYRKLDEQIAARAKAAQAAEEAAAALAQQVQDAIAAGQEPPVVPEATFDERNAASIAAYGWWRAAWDVTGADVADVPFPDDDDLPMWLTANLANRAMIHWVTFPTKAPGTSTLGAEALYALAAGQNEAAG